MTIVEISRRIALPTFWNIQPFVYQFYVNPDYPTHASFWTETFGVTQTPSNRRYFLTGFFRSPNVRYDRELTQELCFANEGSFHWNNDTQIGTVHVEHEYVPWIDSFQGAYAFGFSDERVVYIDDIPYRPLIVSVPRINQSQDLQNYSVPAYLSGSIIMNNLEDNDGDGALDEFISETLNGNDVDIFDLPIVDGQLNYTRDDMSAQAAAYIEDYDFSLTETEFRIQDRRLSQNASIPQTRFFPSEYPDLESGMIGKVVPLLYGQPVNIPALNVNGETTTGAVQYRAAQLLTSLGTVQVDTTGNGNWATVSAATTDLATGSFTLSEGDGRDADGKPLACRLVAPVGIAITRLSDIIIDLRERFLGFAYTATNYDLTEWAAEEISISSGAYYIADEIKLADAIVAIQNGANVGFRYEILPDGRATIRIDNEARASSGHIINRVIANRSELPVKNDISTLAAEVVVGYNTAYNEESFSRVVDDSQADAVELAYRQRPRFPTDGALETMLTDEDDAEERAQYIVDRFSTVRGVAELVLMGQDYLAMRIYDIWTVELTPAEWVNGSEITGRRYYGTRSIKIIETQPDFRSMTNTVRAVIID